MEERVRQLQSRLPMDSRLQAGGAHGRYNPHPNSFFPHQNELEFERLQSRMPVQTLSTRFPSAPVPLEPWDREAILEYRNRVNANSISANPQNSAEEDRGRRVFDNNAQRLRQIFDDSMDFHRSNGHCNLRKLEKKFERTERLGFRQEADRFRNMQNPAVYGRSQRGERPDWPGSRVREEPLYENFGRTQSELLRDQRVRENPDPNPNLISPEERNLSEMRFRYAERIGLKRMNLKRLREVESEDFGRNLMGRSSKYRELGLANDTRSFADRLAERTERWSDRQLCFGPERDMYLGSVAAQSKVRLQQNELQSRADLQRNLIQVGGQKKMICRADQSENELACAENCFGMVGLRERPGSIRAENPSMQGMDDHDNLMLQREPGSSKEDITAATYGMQSTVKNEHVFPDVTKGHSSAGIALGLPQLAKSEGKVQIKGGKLGTPGGLCTKKPNIMHENKNGVWVQSSKKKGKQKRARLLGSAPQRPGSLASLEDGQISHVRQVSDLPEQALEVKQPIHSCQDRERGKMPRIDRSQYERSTADLSVFFKPNGLVAQEVMTSLDKNPPDNANNSSLNSRELIPASSLLDEEVKEHFNTGSVESISSLDQRKSMTDNQKAVAQSKASPTDLLQENIPTSEKESIVESNSRQPFWHLDVIDAKTMMPSAIQSQDRVDPHKTLPLDCKENGNVTVADAKQFDDVPPTAESLLTHAPSFNLEEGLSCTTCSKPNSTDVQDTGLNGSCLGQSTRNAVDMINDSERPQKKFRVNQREELALMAHVISEDPLSTSSVLQPGIEATESQRPMATGQAHLNAALKSGVIQQSAGAFETHSSQKAATSSQNPRLCSSLSQRRSSTFCPPTRPKVIASSVRAARPQTWHRTSNLPGSSVMARPSVILNDDTPAGQSLTKACSSQRAAYVRKGNSLVRTSGPAMGLPGKVPVLPRPSSGGQWTKASPMRNMSKAGDLRKILATGTGNKFVSKGTVSATKYGRSTASSETPRTATLAQTTRLEDCITGSPQSSSHAVMKGTADELAIPTSGSSVIDPVKVVNGHIPGAVNIATESQVTSVPHNLSQVKSNPSEDQGENAGVQMIYVKRKSNQLIAATASKPQGSTASISESGQSLSNCPVQDSYYKRKKNQLVRSSMPMETRNTDVERVSGGGCFPDTKEELKAPKFKTQRSRSVLQTKLGRVLKQKRHGTLQSSWVWTLGGAQFSSASLPLLQTRRAITSLFPWKRPFYGRMNCLGKIKAVPNANKGSLLSLISKRLKRLQKRDAVYTKSVNGFALHRSGVLSLGGSNLKWTKSIEKRSKQANEEATMAVAAAEKKKREEKEAVAEAAAAQAKAERRAVRKAARGIRLHARERIIHVGLVRYKIDPSKWTLQRIPDGRSTCSPDSSLASQIIDTAGLLTPRKRTIIGDEYLRVGNGNQLVRDPRMVSRVLASEKVRWSLHTARSRLAKKQQYCQFFTRFGKCNKEDGKCPYIHDPEKVAVCTKFLKGTCVNVTCKLTHKIIPERMPDCSYFLRGYCTNENCPYRHVNVNPKAPVCEGFLKGYCADGEKCNKKHTYVCPHYAVGGECPERSTCKLHHPKKKDKPKVSSGRKRSNNSKRRYFVAEDLCGGESGCTLLNVHDSEQGELDMPLEATECADFISLNVSWEDPIDHDTSQGTGDPIQRAKSDFDGNLGPPTDDVDMLTKPVRLLWKGPVIDGSMD